MKLALKKYSRKLSKILKLDRPLGIYSQTKKTASVVILLAISAIILVATSSTIRAQISSFWWSGELSEVILVQDDFRLDEEVLINTDTRSQNLKVVVRNHLGEEVETPVEFERNGFRTAIRLLPNENIKPGQYTVEVSNESGIIITQNFNWGILAINPNKSIYSPYETAKLAFGVLDEAGKMVCNAKLDLEILNQQDEVIAHLSTTDGTIQVNPECYKKSFTLKPDYEADYDFSDVGVYNLRLSAETKNGHHSIKDKIEVKENIEFDIERETATRIFPPHPYPVNITIIPKHDFTGTVVEAIPDSFELVEHTANKVVNIGSKQMLIWEVEWLGGQSYELEYQYDAPNISPDFYLLGPVNFFNQPLSAFNNNYVLQKYEPIFTENRQWQIAVDNVITLETYTITPASGNGTSITGDKPTGTVLDDVLVAVVVFNNTGVTVSPPDGSWVEVVTHNNTANRNAALFYKVATNSEPSDYTFTYSAEAGGRKVAIHRYSGVDTSSVSDATPTQARGGSTTPTGPSLTLGTENAMVLHITTVSGSVTGKEQTSPPTDLSLIYSDELRLTLNNGIKTSSGATGDLVATWNSSVNWMVIAWAMTPAADTGPTPIYLSGTAYSDVGVTPLGADKTVNLRINGSGSHTTETTSGGLWSIEVDDSILSEGDVVAVYLAGETEKATNVFVSDGTTTEDIDLYQNYIIAGHDSGASITNDHFYTAHDASNDISYTVSGATGGTLTADQNIGLYIRSQSTFAPGGNVVVGGNWINNGTFTSGSNTVTMNATTSGKTLTSGGGSSFHNLTFSGVGGAWTLQDSLNVSSVIDVTAGTLNASSQTIILTGSSTPFTVSDTFNAGTSTVSYEGTSATTIAPLEYYNLQTNPASGTPTYTLTGNITGDLLINNDLNLTGAGTGTIDANTNDPELTIEGNMTIGNNQTFIASNISPLTVKGNWTNNSTFTHSSGVTYLTGANQAYSGSTTFYDLFVTGTIARTITFTGNSTTAIANNGSLTFSGAADNLLTLQSSDTNAWNLQVSETGTTVSVSHVSVSRSNAGGFKEIDASNGTNFDGDNNINWNFGDEEEAPALNKLMRHGGWFNSLGIRQPFSF
jgi:hypothetical protein